MISLLVAAEGWVELLVTRFHYVGPALVLVLCGIGLPIPEEVTLIACGLLLYQGKVAFLPITLVCAAAILAGDSVPYYVGRRYGPRAMEHRWVARFLHAERLAVVEVRFRKYGSWGVFVCRFLPGIRIPAYFSAGTLGMSYPRFVLLDALGVLISVPTSIYIAMLFGGQIERLEAQVENFHLVLFIALIAVIGVVIYRVLGRRRERQAAALRAEQDRPGP